MNLLAAMQSRRKTEKFSRDSLPDLNAFIDVATGGHTEHLPVEYVGRDQFEIRCPANAEVGTISVFNYSNRRGRYRFSANCDAIARSIATYGIPKQITIIEEFDNKRRNVRLKALLPITWRYAPDGVGYGDFVAGTSSDISCVGMSMVIPRPLKVGTPLEIKFDLADGAPPFTVIGTVARSTDKQREGKLFAGLAFKGIRPTEANRIAQFINVRQRDQRKRALAD